MSIDRPAWQARGDTEVCQGGRFGLQRPKRGWIKDDIRVLFSVRYSIRERMNISSHLLCQSFEFFSFTPFGAVMLIFSFFCCWPLINKSTKKKEGGSDRCFDSLKEKAVKYDAIAACRTQRTQTKEKRGNFLPTIDWFVEWLNKLNASCCNVCWWILIS